MINTIFYKNKKITIIGTAHISKKSKEKVKEIIDIEKPDVVGVELDRNRFRSIMNKDYKREIKFSHIFKARKPVLFLVYYVLHKFQKKIALRFDTTPGEEMVQGIISAQENNSKLLLLDRDSEFTLNKLIKNLTLRDKLRLLFGGFSVKKELGKDFDINTLLKSVEDEENNKKVNQILEIFMKRHKTLKKVLIDERDQFMAYGIRKILEQEEINSMVVVVGAGHMEGLSKEIFNDNIDVKKLLNIKLEK
jgi:pheromone shutdown-related protein TraB